MKLFKKLENLLSAAAFAEEGEFDTARRIAAEPVEAGPRCIPEEGTRAGSPQIATGQLAPKA